MSTAPESGALQRYRHHVDGRWLAPVNGRYLASLDPSNAEPWYEFADGGAEDIDVAVQAARAALVTPAWRRMTASARGALLRRLAELVGEHAERLAAIETRDNGKLLREMRAQVAYLPEVYHYFAGMADKVQGDTIPINKLDMLNYTQVEPIGVVGVIVPWNSPLYLLSSCVAPCLALGNTIVAKPSEHTSASALEFARLVEEAGFPPGVFNVVTGLGESAGDALSRHPGVAKIAFTGGTETGRKVAANAASHLAPCILELGGKSPHVVFDDADPARAANGIIAGVFAAAGQTCIAGSRAFVHERIHDELMERLLARTRAIVIGHPAAEATELGPIALAGQLAKIDRYVGYGVADGGTLLHGGKRPERAELGAGWYYEPTIFADVTPRSRICTDEIFGPVLAVMKFDAEADLMRMANDTAYGLAAGVWTRDIDRAMRFARDVDAGTVWVNTYRSASFMTPAGGFKQSGYGKHNGFAAMREFSRTKSVVIDYSGTTQDPFVMRIK